MNRTVGRVRIWDDEHGWGVVDSPATPGGCWTHYSAIATDGFRTLGPGQDVELEWEAADQDGYRFRTVRTWPHGSTPVTPETSGEATSAYRSSLTITFDDQT